MINWTIRRSVISYRAIFNGKSAIFEQDCVARSVISSGIAYGQIINSYRASIYTEQAYIIPNGTDCKAIAVNRYIAGYNVEATCHSMNAIAGDTRCGNINSVSAAACHAAVMVPLIVRVVVGSVDSFP